VAEETIWQDVLWVVGAITAVLVLFETMRRTIASPLVKWLRVAADFLADWNGHPARHGVDAVPGVMARLQTIADKMERVEYHTGNGQEPALREIVKGHAERLDTHINETNVLIEDANKREARQEARIRAIERALGLTDNDFGDGPSGP